MAKLRVTVTMMECLLGMAPLRANIAADGGYVYFEIYGPDVPDVDMVTIRTTKTIDVKLEPVTGVT